MRKRLFPGLSLLSTASSSCRCNTKRFFGASRVSVTKTDDTLGERMKEYEDANETFLSSDSPIIIRLDGHRFSQFTKEFNKPSDERLGNAMILTSADLLRFFPNARSAYTFSDEISLIFPANTTEGTDPDSNFFFRGRVQKLISLAAGYASARFNFHLHHQTFDSTKDEQLLAKLRHAVAWFDARGFNVPTNLEAWANIKWRGMDCRRNSRNNLGRVYFSTKELKGVPSPVVVEKVLSEKGVDWNGLSDYFKCGLVVKKKLKNKTTFVPHLGKNVDTMRTVFISGGLNHLEALQPEVAAQVLMLKYLNYYEEANSLTNEDDKARVLLESLMSNFKEVEESS